MLARPLAALQCVCSNRAGSVAHIAMPFTADRLTLRRGLVAAVVAVHLGLSLFAVAPGHLSVDEGTYHFMVRSWDEGRGVEVWNGYDERASPELVAATFSVEDGRLVGVPPELYPLLAVPFYRLAGYRGLFAFNALAFLALLALTFRLARRLTGEEAVAWDACLLLAVATFLWDYSQAAWPHATSALFVLAAFSAMAIALDAPAGWRRWGWAVVAGLVAGFAPGIRLDAAFALPAVLLPFLFAHPPRWRSALAAMAGMLPGLAVLAAVNAAKFGDWTPFTYGRDGGGANSGVTPYLPLVAAAVALVVLAWVVSRPAVAHRLAARWRFVAATALAAVALALVLPASRELLVRLAEGTAQLVVDLRLRDPTIAEPALGRSPRGALIYVGALKKSLLQSCPWLTALVLPALAAWKRPELRRPLALLALVPAAFLAPYALFAWHGGLALNLRYLVPTLPFFAILGAVAGHRLWPAGEGDDGSAGAGGAWRWVAAAGVGLLAAAFTLTLGDPQAWPAPRLEPLLLDLPLALAAALLLLAAAAHLLGRRAGALLRGAAAVAFALAVAHAALVTFAYDARWSHDLRHHNVEATRRALPHVAEDSILFTPFPDPYYGLIEVDRLRLAVGGRDGFADFRPLTDLHLAAGRPVFASLPPAYWRMLSDRGDLEGLEVALLTPDGFVARVQPAGTAQREEGQAP